MHAAEKISNAMSIFTEHFMCSIPKSKIEVLCSDKDVEKIVNIIRTSATTGEKGDGIVFSYKIDKLVKIRDGETDTSAL